MTRAEYVYTVIVSLLMFFFGWMVTPTLDRMREKWRDRMNNAPLTPENQGEMLKQLRWQQASLARLEQFRAHPKDLIVYLIGLLSAALLLFTVAVYLYPFHLGPVVNYSVFPAAASLLFFMVAILESRNMTDKKMSENLVKLKKVIEEGKAKLKISE
jgi:hypothetical protein